MGDPRKTRKKYETPGHPWIASRIESERDIRRSFGTKSKREIYKMETFLKRFKDQAKSLTSRTDAQAEKERAQMMDRMTSLGLIKVGSGLDDILSLSTTDIMNRRLQTIMVKGLLARTPKQARQLITHGHVLVDGKVITSPSYIVKISEESNITFKASSPFNNEQHPERFSEEELRAKEERAKAKAAKKVETEEEAPPAYSEEDIVDPEELALKAAKKPKTEVKPEVKPVAEEKAETKKPEEKAEDAKEQSEKAEPAEKTEEKPAKKGDE